jgi:hypothetical protein
MEIHRRMVAAAEQAARRDSASFRHWSGRSRCAVCGRALARGEREIRIHGVPMHGGCAAFNTDGYAA